MRILGPTPPRLPTGTSDYVQLRRAGLTYVDKTTFIAQVLGTDTAVQLHPRPRRFGKTLNLSTVRHFLERGAPDLTDLFADTEIWEAAGGAHRAHFQRHPVIWLTFKDVKYRTWDEAWLVIRSLLQHEFHRLWAAHDLAAHLAASPEAQVVRAALSDPNASPAALGNLLPTLSRWCAEATGEPVVILIDEYDAALLTAWQHGYWDDAVSFFRAFYSAGLKDNAHLLRGVLTGILRVAKEGIFSGLNNVGTYGLLTAEGATHFGFTVPEVETLAHAHGLGERLPEIAAWYNGYRFGGAVPHTLYNPWSLIQYLSRPEDGFLPYWKNTSSNELINELLLRQAAEVGPQVARLLVGETTSVRVDENVTLDAIRRSPLALWSLLLSSGYLTPEHTENGDLGPVCDLRIPNREVAAVYRTTFLDVLAQAGNPDAVPNLAAALLRGDGPQSARALGHLLKTAMSFHDFGPRPVEAIYQAFIIGLLLHLEPTHRVRSNRESGFGRADVLIMPRAHGAGSSAGVVLELKVVETDYDEAPHEALAAAALQLRQRQYATEVRAAGATEVHQYAVVFDGKRCWVESVPEGA